MTTQRYSIIIVSSEVFPFAKTRGLGDMVASLATGFRRKGHDVHVVLPLLQQDQGKRDRFAHRSAVHVRRHGGRRSVMRRSSYRHTRKCAALPCRA